MATLKSLGLFSQFLNTGAEYAIREDGAVFSLNKVWNDNLPVYTSSYLNRYAYW